MWCLVTGLIFEVARMFHFVWVDFSFLSWYRKQYSNSTFLQIVFAVCIVCASYALGFYMTAVFLQGLSMPQYGRLVLAQKLIYITSSVLLLGTRNVAKHFLLEYRDKNLSKLSSFIRWHMQYIFIIILFFYLFYILAFLLLYFFSLKDYIEFGVEIFSVSVSPFYALFGIMSIYLLCFGYPLIYNFIQALLGNGVWLLTFFCLLFFQPIITDSWLIVLVVASTVVSFILVFCIFLFFLYKDLMRVILLNQVYVIDPAWTQNRVYSLLLDLYFFLPSTIVLCISSYFSGYDVSGQIALCFSIGIFYFLVSASLGPLKFDHLSAEIDYDLGRVPHKKNSTDSIFKIVNRVVLILGVLFLGLVFVYGHQILFLFGQDSPSMYFLLLEVCLLYFLMSYYFPTLNFALIYSGETKFIARIEIFMYATLTLLGPWLAFYFGKFY